jgi:hypothetical protein
LGFFKKYIASRFLARQSTKAEFLFLKKRKVTAYRHFCWQKRLWSECFVFGLEIGFFAFAVSLVLSGC